MERGQGSLRTAEQLRDNCPRAQARKARVDSRPEGIGKIGHPQLYLPHYLEVLGAIEKA